MVPKMLKTFIIRPIYKSRPKADYNKYRPIFILPLLEKVLEEVVVPKMLKTFIIRPIYKSRPKADYNKYRPIFILPLLEKVLEEVVVRRLNNFLKKFSIIDKDQFIFQKGRKINNLLGNFANFINSCLSTKKHCLVLFINFRKPFYTLSHNKLLQILERNS